MRTNMMIKFIPIQFRYTLRHWRQTLCVLVERIYLEIFVLAFYYFSVFFLICFINHSVHFADLLFFSVLCVEVRPRHLDVHCNKGASKQKPINPL